MSGHCYEFLHLLIQGQIKDKRCVGRMLKHLLRWEDVCRNFTRCSVLSDNNQFGRQTSKKTVFYKKRFTRIESFIMKQHLQFVEVFYQNEYSVKIVLAIILLRNLKYSLVEVCFTKLFIQKRIS